MHQAMESQSEWGDNNDGHDVVQGTTDDAINESFKSTVGSLEEVEGNAEGSFLNRDNSEHILHRGQHGCQ